MALLGHCVAEPLALLRLVTPLEAKSDPAVVTFVLDRGDGFADYGYAATAWVVDLYGWAVTQAPERQRHRIIGLLLGYSPEAIRAFEERNSGRLFASPILSPEPTSS